MLFSFDRIITGEHMNREKEFINLANNIKKYRLLRGYTQEEFAEKIGKTSNFVSQIENAHKGIHLSTLFDLADALDVPVKSLFEPCEKVSGKITKYKKVYH